MCTSFISDCMRVCSFREWVTCKLSRGCDDALGHCALGIHLCKTLCREAVGAALESVSRSQDDV
jgi:hypothetical protein